MWRFNTQLAACKKERDALHEGVARACRVAAARREIADKAEAASVELAQSVKAERDKASNIMAQAERKWTAREERLQEEVRIAQETGRKALEEARNEALKELEEERSEREAEREAAATERTDIVRVHAEKLQTLKDAF